MVWAGHYSTTDLREMTAPRLPPVKEPLGQVALGMMSVFASPEVDASWLVIDCTRIPEAFNLSRVLVVSCLAMTGSGVWNGNWKVNAEGVAHRTFYEFPEVNRAISAIMDRRLAGPTVSFEDAFWAAVEVGKELYA